jgi:anti-sigma regulatory factor (Ser/Thr protein kinase)/biotin operon repressor
METKEKILAILSRQHSVSGGELRQRLGLTRQAMSVHLRALLAAHRIVRSGTTRGARYSLAGRAQRPTVITRVLPTRSCDEDRAWDQIAAQLNLHQLLRPNIFHIVRYAFTEMLNNAIDHSHAEQCMIRFTLGPSWVGFEIRDAGIGVFHSIASKHHLPDEETALVELLKGKTTTMPEAHTGEGIFFTSRVGDDFILRSHRIQIEWKRAKHDVFVSQQRFLKGTDVRFLLHRNARHKLEEVFDEFAPAEYDFQFQKTRVLVKLLQPDYVSRSEAKRLLANLEKFREIVLDFRGVRSVGQGFADEVFRVFAQRHSGIVIHPENANPAVLAMIRHVSRGTPAEAE